MDKLLASKILAEAKIAGKISIGRSSLDTCLSSSSLVQDDSVSNKNNSDDVRRRQPIKCN